MKQKKWTEQENKYIREHYLITSTDALASRFGVTVKSILHKLERLGLKGVGGKPERRTGSEVKEQKWTSRLTGKPNYNVQESNTTARKEALRLFDSAIRDFHAGKRKEGREKMKRIVASCWKNGKFIKEKDEQIYDIICVAKRWL